jgi:CSLREA domain-containing protein
MRPPTRLHTVPLLRTIGIASVSLSLVFSSGLSAQTTFTVNVVDDADDGSCAVGHCSLREAITAANHAEDGGIIHFNIPGAGPHTIQPLSALPALEDDVIIDGTSEPDFTGTPVIELDGSLAGDAHGFDIVGSENLVRGLVINRFAWNGIQINTDCTLNVIEGNFIGTDLTGTLDLGNGNGVGIGGAQSNTVGGTSASARNLISGNTEGITIVGATANANVVMGNYIGTDVTGTLSIPNSEGVLLLAPDNTIGGTAVGAGNLISGNASHGVSVGLPDASGNVILGNHIGVDATGTIALGNDIGVWVDNAADNVIGGTAAGARNVISGNREGITFWNPGSTGNLVQGNYIGTNATGSAAIPNGMGLAIYSPENTIGGAGGGAGNLISGNLANGVNFYGSDATGNTVQGNLIGTDADGTMDLGNGESGVALIFASGNTIGGTASGTGNVISGNTIAGVFVLGEDADSNAIQGNYLGTDPTGTIAIGNGESGVALHSATNTLIGGTDAGAGNVLSGNTFGILIGNLLATGNRIQGNHIGTNADGDAAIPNTQSGILIWGENTTIGGTEAGARNVISGNAGDGIGLAEASTSTVIQGNYIGTDASGTTALGNATGISMNFSPANTIGGTQSGAGNVISGNGGYGVTVTGSSAAGNVVRGNHIGTDASGTARLPNDIGIRVLDAPDNSIGGTEPGAGNVISGNARNGIRLLGPDATGNVVLGNYFGTDATGTMNLGNGTGGVILGNQASGNTVGSTAAGGGNVVAFNGRGGIALTVNAGANNQFRSNSVFENLRLGIDLANDLVTANDSDDSDTGPNNLQNFPALTSVASNDGVSIQATLNSSPSSTFGLDFFSNVACDESGNGEGRTPLGSSTLTTDASGSGTGTAAFSNVSGTILTATATDANGNTSEFSQCGDLTTLAVSSNPTTRTVTPGQTATYTIRVTAQGGVFDETVAMGCSGAPSGASCTLANEELDLTSGEVNTILTVTTVAPATSTLVVPRRLPRIPLGWFWALLLSLPGFALVLMGIRTLGQQGKTFGLGSRPVTRAGWVVLAAFGGLLLVLQTSCGSDGTSPPTGGTAAGTYELTVTATWESVQQTGTVTLVVQ